MNTFKNLIIVFLGGGIGSCIRFLISKLFYTNSNSFPWGTFIANLAGCFLFGFFSSWFIKNFRSEWIIFFTMKYPTIIFPYYNHQKQRFLEKNPLGSEIHHRYQQNLIQKQPHYL